MTVFLVMYRTNVSLFPIKPTLICLFWHANTEKVRITNDNISEQHVYTLNTMSGFVVFRRTLTNTDPLVRVCLFPYNDETFNDYFHYRSIHTVSTEIRTETKGNISFLN